MKMKPLQSTISTLIVLLWLFAFLQKASAQTQRVSFSKAILAFGIFSLMAVSITDARQRGGPPQPGALPKLTKVLDDIYLIENAGQTVAEIGTYGGNITLALSFLLLQCSERMVSDRRSPQRKSGDDG